MFEKLKFLFGFCLILFVLFTAGYAFFKIIFSSHKGINPNQLSLAHPKNADSSFVNAWSLSKDVFEKQDFLFQKTLIYQISQNSQEDPNHYCAMGLAKYLGEDNSFFYFIKINRVSHSKLELQSQIHGGHLFYKAVPVAKASSMLPCDKWVLIENQSPRHQMWKLIQGSAESLKLKQKCKSFPLAFYAKAVSWNAQIIEIKADIEKDKLLLCPRSQGRALVELESQNPPQKIKKFDVFVLPSKNNSSRSSFDKNWKMEKTIGGW